MSSKKMFLPKKQMVLAVIVLLALIIFSAFFSIQSMNNELTAKENNSLEENSLKDSNEINKALPFVKILLVKNNCEDCFNIDLMVKQIYSFDVNVLEVKTINADSVEGINLIKMHDLNSLPAIIINGDFKGTDLETQWKTIGEEKNGVLIASRPPYYSLKEKRVKGKVDLLLIKNSSCEDCIDLNFFAGDLRELGVVVENERTIEFDSEEGQSLIEFYFIDRVPVVLLSSEIGEYSFLKPLWSQIGIIASDGTYIYNEAVPFFDLFSKETKGLVEVIKLIDVNCFDCIDVNAIVSPLTKMGLKIVKEETVDVSSEKGKELIKKYSITKIPTILVSNEAEEYTDFFVVWPKVGTKDENVFVFRNLEILGGKFITLK